MIKLLKIFWLRGAPPPELPIRDSVYNNSYFSYTSRKNEKFQWKNCSFSEIFTSLIISMEIFRKLPHISRLCPTSQPPKNGPPNIGWTPSIAKSFRHYLFVDSELTPPKNQIEVKTSLMCFVVEHFNVYLTLLVIVLLFIPDYLLVYTFNHLRKLLPTSRWNLKNKQSASSFHKLEMPFYYKCWYRVDKNLIASFYVSRIMQNEKKT